MDHSNEQTDSTSFNTKMKLKNKQLLSYTQLLTKRAKNLYTQSLIVFCHDCIRTMPLLTKQEKLIIKYICYKWLTMLVTLTDHVYNIRSYIY